MVYKAFGMIIYSNIEIPELNNLDCEDVLSTESIHIEYLGEYEEDRGNYGNISINKAIYNYRDIGSFIIENGNSIKFEKYKGVDQYEFGQYLFGVIIGTLMFQRGMLIFHGGCVNINNQGVILTGSCGAGKSSLLSCFIKNGYKFMSDDISIVKNVNQIPYSFHGYPQHRICFDTAEKLKYNTQSLNIVANYDGKMLIDYYEMFHTQEIPLKAIFHVAIGDVKEVELYELKGIYKMDVLIQNIYSDIIFKELKLVSQYLEKFSELANKMKIYRILRPKEGFTVNKQMDKIIRELEHAK